MRLGELSQFRLHKMSIIVWGLVLVVVWYNSILQANAEFNPTAKFYVNYILHINAILFKKHSS